MAERVLMIGVTGGDVLEVQAFLNAVLLIPPLLDMDGDFGPATRERVVRFQMQNKLDPDGIVGPQTRAALFKLPRGSGDIGNLMNFDNWELALDALMVQGAVIEAQAEGIDLSGRQFMDIKQFELDTAKALRNRVEEIVRSFYTNPDPPF